MFGFGELGRIGLLFVVLATAAAIDRLRNRDSTRWREYGFLVTFGLLGGAFGILNDLLTIRLSPEYFLHGKGIEAGPGFRTDVLRLGFHAGFLAGAVVAGVLLLANNPRPGRPSLGDARLARFATRPLFAALSIGVATMMLCLIWDPLGYATEFRGLIAEERLSHFRAVAGFHFGLYAGALLGTVWAFLGVRRARREHAGRVHSNTDAP